ncbi:succinyldiaminopimelate transaminase [Hylemonella sp. W303a]|uniref:succinyldiaminopimelate transaminase n=1 Tax=Hylemonella sp. W303a TaxID=3389873 RepID=UPI00396B24AB
MNPLLQKLQPYPFERLRKLFEGVTPNPAYRPISLGIGEPKHPTPDFIKQTLNSALYDPSNDLAAYPPTAGTPKLRAAFTDWLKKRYGLELDPATQVLPVNGSREALFAFAQTVVDPGQPGATVVCPNPFYQIYEGAALLAGATPYFAPSDPKRNFAVDWDSVPEAVWQRTQLLFVCSPGNPTGAVMPLDEWKKLFELSDRHGFVIASDECYSEIYFRDEPPLGGLEAAAKLGRGFERLVAFTSLSKRSNVPGLRSGFVMGDAALLKAFLLYRTYHGSAMAPPTQAASIAAWNDEAHVIANREQYRAKFARVTPILAEVLDVALPDAGFYLWAGVRGVCGGDDAAFARELLAQYNVTVLPGSYLARESNSRGAPSTPGLTPAMAQDPGHNPGRGRIRMALVAETAECEEAARRIVQFVQSHQ